MRTSAGRRSPPPSPTRPPTSWSLLRASRSTRWSRPATWWSEWI